MHVFHTVTSLSSPRLLTEPLHLTLCPLLTSTSLFFHSFIFSSLCWHDSEFWHIEKSNFWNLLRPVLIISSWFNFIILWYASVGICKGLNDEFFVSFFRELVSDMISYQDTHSTLRLLRSLEFTTLLGDFSSQRINRESCIVSISNDYPIVRYQKNILGIIGRFFHGSWDGCNFIHADNIWENLVIQ